jgi:hypothetical protein
MLQRAIESVRRAGHSARQLAHFRPLLPVEQRFLSAEFGDSLDLSRLRLTGGGHPLGRIGWQPGGGMIQLCDAAFEAHDPTQPVRLRYWPVLAHEALHVWQRVHRHYRVGVSVDGLVLGALRGRAAYRYAKGNSDPAAVLDIFLAGNIEQQAQIFEDYVRSNVLVVQARDVRFCRVARYVRE